MIQKFDKLNLRFEQSFRVNDENLEFKRCLSGATSPAYQTTTLTVKPERRSVENFPQTDSFSDSRSNIYKKKRNANKRDEIAREKRNAQCKGRRKPNDFLV